MRGVRLKIEIGPKDVANGTVGAIKGATTLAKEGRSFVPQEGLAERIGETLSRGEQESLYKRALAFRETNTGCLHKTMNNSQNREPKEGFAFSYLVRQAPVRSANQTRYKSDDTL